MMKALVTEPGITGSARVEDFDPGVVNADDVPVRVLEVGVCGTDREIAHGLFGVAPSGERALVHEPGSQLIAVPPTLGRLGVLAEPTSICARALRHARAIGGRQPWQLERALVIGAGAVGTLLTFLLRLDGAEVWTASLEPANDLIEATGARYVSTADTPLAELGHFDLV